MPPESTSSTAPFLVQKARTKFFGLTLDEVIQSFFGGNAFMAVVVLALITFFLFREGYDFFGQNRHNLQVYRSAGLEYVDIMRQQEQDHTALTRYLSDLRLRTWQHLTTKGGLSAAAGLGFSATKTLSLRGGYDGRIGGGEYAGLTSGVGLSFGSVTLDYAFSPFGELGSVQRISATWAYGGSRRAEVRETHARRAVRAGGSRGVTGRGGEYKYTYRRPK